MDGLTHKELSLLGIINFVLIKNFHYMALTYFLIKFVSLLNREKKEISTKGERTLEWDGEWWDVLVFFLPLEGYVYLEAPVANKPLIISHREYLIRMVCKIQSNL